MQVNIQIEHISMTLVADDGSRYLFTAAKGHGDFDVQEREPEFDPNMDKAKYMTVPSTFHLVTDIQLFYDESEGRMFLLKAVDS